MYLTINRCSDGVEMANPEQHIFLFTNLCICTAICILGNPAKMYPPRGKGLITEFVFVFRG